MRTRSGPGGRCRLRCDCYRLSGGGGDDRGVVAARAIDASPSQPVELVVVPFDAMLHATAALVCNSQAEAAAAKAFAAVANKLTREDDVLACRLLFERHLGDRSRWFQRTAAPARHARPLCPALERRGARGARGLGRAAHGGQMARAGRGRFQGN